ncbi:MAG: hypothetical protein JJU20_03615, partial [Opitutales bacterium]|nr:hypothetical protein [Opitutales bacterium]
LTAPHLARGYAWARSPQTRAAVHRLGVSGVQQVQGLAGQVAFPSVRTLGVSGVSGGVSGGFRSNYDVTYGFEGLSGVEMGILAPVSIPFLFMDALVYETTR